MMKSKKSWFNLPLLKNVIKNNILPAKVSLLLFGGFLLLGMITVGAFQIAIFIFSISAVLLTTIYAGVVQGFLSNKTDSTYMRTLPILSFSLWLTQYVAGFLLILVPLLIELAGIYIGSVYHSLSISSDLFTFRILLSTILLVFIYYSISFFVVCISGKRIGQFLLTFAFYSLPAGLYGGIISLGNLLTMGHVAINNFEKILLFLPVLSAGEYVKGTISSFESTSITSNTVSNLSFISYEWPYLIFHICIAIAFFVGSYFVYKYRPLEKTDQMIIFNSLNYIIRMVIVVVITMILYLLFIYSTGIVYSYGGREFVLNILLYMVIGVVVALAVELVFRSQHIYRNLGIQIPIICCSIFLCYQVGYYNYQNSKAMFDDTANIIMEGIMYEQTTNDQTWLQEENYFSLSINKNILETITSYLEEHKSQLYSNVPLNTDTIHLRFLKQDDENWRDELVSYYVSTEVFRDLMETNNHSLCKEIMKNKMERELELLKLHPYWIVSPIYETDEEVLSIMTRDDLIAMYENYDIDTCSYDTLFIVGEDSIYWREEWIGTSIISSSRAQEIIYQSQNTKRGSLVMEAVEFLEKTLYGEKSLSTFTNTSVEGKHITKGDTIVLFENGFISYLVSLQDNTLEFEIPMEILTGNQNDQEVYHGMYRVVVVFDNGEMTITKIIEKEI